MSATSPALVSVTSCGRLDVPSCCAAKLRLSGVRVSVGGFVPVPVRDATWVPVESEIVKVPDRGPETVGANEIETVQPVDGDSVVPHEFAEMEKSLVMTGVWRVAIVPPVFEIVMV